MDSAGNDVVAFRLTDPERSAQPRFYQQILSPSETDLFQSGAFPFSTVPLSTVPLSTFPPSTVLSSTDPHSTFPPVPDFQLFLWLCWSVKESVYKFRKREQPDLIYSPTSISVKEITSSNGQITGSSEDLFFRTTLIPGGIHTVVHQEPEFKGVRSGYGFVPQTSGPVEPLISQAPSPETQSSAVRDLVLSDVHTWDPKGFWSFGKHADGYPLLFREGILQPIPLSLAHHDQLLGFSYFLPGS
jgi:hypothetical protein